jgi:hypothetical protein
MLRFIQNTFFWKQTFDSEWTSASIFFTNIKVPDGRRCDLTRWERCQEKRAYWRETMGQRLGCTPREAAYRSLEEYAETFLKEYRSHKCMESSFEDIAFALHAAAPYLDRDGRFVDQTSFLRDHWKAYYIRYRERRDGERQ